jgi:hypothetical protein
VYKLDRFFDDRVVQGEAFIENRTMTPLQIAVIIGLSIVLLKFVASLFGYGNIPILNKLVTVILSIFVTFEIIKLVQAIAIAFG